MWKPPQRAHWHDGWNAKNLESGYSEANGHDFGRRYTGGRSKRRPYGEEAETKIPTRKYGAWGTRNRIATWAFIANGLVECFYYERDIWGAAGDAGR